MARLRRHSTQHIRHQRDRYIRRRVRRLNWQWLDAYPDNWAHGRVAKWNTVCSCWMCDRQRHPDTRPRIIASDISMREDLAEL